MLLDNKSSVPTGIIRTVKDDVNREFYYVTKMLDRSGNCSLIMEIFGR